MINPEIRLDANLLTSFDPNQINSTNRMGFYQASDGGYVFTTQGSTQGKKLVTNLADIAQLLNEGHFHVYSSNSVQDDVSSAQYFTTLYQKIQKHNQNLNKQKQSLWIKCFAWIPLLGRVLNKRFNHLDESKVEGLTKYYVCNFRDKGFKDSIESSKIQAIETVVQTIDSLNGKDLKEELKAIGLLQPVLLLVKEQAATADQLFANANDINALNQIQNNLIRQINELKVNSIYQKVGYQNKTWEKATRCVETAFEKRAEQLFPALSLAKRLVETQCVNAQKTYGEILGLQDSDNCATAKQAYKSLTMAIAQEYAITEKLPQKFRQRLLQANQLVEQASLQWKMDRILYVQQNNLALSEMLGTTDETKFLDQFKSLKDLCESNPVYNENKQALIAHYEVFLTQGLGTLTQSGKEKWTIPENMQQALTYSQLVEAQAHFQTLIDQLKEVNKAKDELHQNDTENASANLQRAFKQAAIKLDPAYGLAVKINEESKPAKKNKGLSFEDYQKNLQELKQRLTQSWEGCPSSIQQEIQQAYQAQKNECAQMILAQQRIDKEALDNSFLTTVYKTFSSPDLAEEPLHSYRRTVGSYLSLSKEECTHENIEKRYQLFTEVLENSQFLLGNVEHEMKNYQRAMRLQPLLKEYKSFKKGKSLHKNPCDIFFPKLQTTTATEGSIFCLQERFKNQILEELKLEAAIQRNNSKGEELVKALEYLEQQLPDAWEHYLNTNVPKYFIQMMPIIKQWNQNVANRESYHNLWKIKPESTLEQARKQWKANSEAVEIDNLSSYPKEVIDKFEEAKGYVNLARQEWEIDSLIYRFSKLSQQDTETLKQLKNANLGLQALASHPFISDILGISLIEEPTRFKELNTLVNTNQSAYTSNQNRQEKAAQAKDILANLGEILPESLKA